MSIRFLPIVTNKKYDNINDDKFLENIPESSLKTYNEVKHYLKKIYALKCMDTYHTQYDQCESIRKLLIISSFEN